MPRRQQGGSAAIAGTTFGLAGRLRLSFGDPRALFRDALEREIAERRPFLWLPAAAGAGVILYLSADREPVLWLPALAAIAFAALAWLARAKRGGFALFVALAAVSAGFVSAGWKSARVAAPVLDRIRVTSVSPASSSRWIIAARARASSCGSRRQRACRPSRCRAGSG